jgi:hypothetical protein
MSPQAVAYLDYTLEMMMMMMIDDHNHQDHVDGVGLRH